MTEFRRDQAKVLLLTILRTLAPRMAGKHTLRKLWKELLDDRALWGELEAARTPPPVDGPTA